MASFYSKDGYPMRLLLLLALVALALPAYADGDAGADGGFIVVQSTTSTRNSGLYDAILPQFTEATGIQIRVVAVGTGQALRNARNCDGDVLLVHATAAEEEFVEDGYGLSRTDLMYNDFVLVGPSDDPARVADTTSINAALSAIADSRAPFASRGDDSGTHKKERSLWAGAEVDPSGDSGTWYRETGSGMGATLNIASGMNAYTLTDRATWIAFANKGDLRILAEGDEDLFNQYGIIAINPVRCPAVKATPAQTFIDWLLSDGGQSAIAAYRRDGQQLFFPNAKPE